MLRRILLVLLLQDAYAVQTGWSSKHHHTPSKVDARERKPVQKSPAALSFIPDARTTVSEEHPGSLRSSKPTSMLQLRGEAVSVADDDEGGGAPGWLSDYLSSSTDSFTLGRKEQPQNENAADQGQAAQSRSDAQEQPQNGDAADQGLEAAQQATQSQSGAQDGGNDVAQTAVEATSESEALSSTEESNTSSAEGASLDLPSFYLYEDEVLNSTTQLAGCEDGSEWPSYVDVIGPLVAQLQTHPSRVSDPDQAQWFVVPFDFDRNEAVGKCHDVSAADRVKKALDLLESDKHFEATKGANYFMVAMRWRIYPGWPNQDAAYFPPDRRGLLQNMAVGQYMDYHLRLSDTVYGFDAVGLNETSWWRQGYDWRCTVVFPVQSATGLWQPDESFETWNQRSNILFFRGHGPQQCMHGAEELRTKAADLKGVIPNSILENTHADSFESYVKEITSSKFCLVMRCDDPQTSRFVDSLAAGCIPIFISDGLDLAAKPFSAQINYDAFSVSIPESLWKSDAVAAAHFAYNWPEARIKQMQSALMEARRHLLWSHPESDVSSYALQELASQCAP